MTEIRDTFRGGHDAQMETRRGGRGMWRGIPLPIWPGGLGSIINFSSGVQGGAEVENGFSVYWAKQNAETSKWSPAFWSTAWTATHLDVKLGQIRGRIRNSGQFSVLNDLDLVFFSGQALKIRIMQYHVNKSGTDGHLRYVKIWLLINRDVTEPANIRMCRMQNPSDADLSHGQNYQLL